MRVIVVVVLALALTACSDDDTTPEEMHEEHEGTLDEEACEHHEEGPFADVAASLDADAAPVASIEHTSVRIALAEGFEGGHGGYVTVEADEDADFGFFLTADVPVQIVDGEFEESSGASETCPDLVAASHIAELSVGTHVLAIGPTDVESVSLVLEELGGEHGDDDEHDDEQE